MQQCIVLFFLKKSWACPGSNKIGTNVQILPYPGRVIGYTPLPTQMLGYGVPPLPLTQQFRSKRRHIFEKIPEDTNQPRNKMLRIIVPAT